MGWAKLASVQVTLAVFSSELSHTSHMCSLCRICLLFLIPFADVIHETELIAALRNHASCVGVCQAAMIAIRNLAAGASNKTRFVDVGSCEGVECCFFVIIRPSFLIFMLFML